MIERSDTEIRMLQSVGKPLAFLHRHGAVHAEAGTFGVVIHAIRQRLRSATPTGYIGNQSEIFGWSAVAKGWSILISAAGTVPVISCWQANAART